jgi:hypothetical protein
MRLTGLDIGLFISRKLQQSFRILLPFSLNAQTVRDLWNEKNGKTNNSQESNHEYYMMLMVLFCLLVDHIFVQQAIGF